MTIQPFDDSQFQADVARLRAYLQWCNEQLATRKPAPKASRLKAIDRELAKHRSTHVYLLPAGTKGDWQPSASRKFAAPVWTTIQDAA